MDNTFFLASIDHGISISQKQRQRSSLLVGGRNWFISLPHNRFSARMIWRDGCIEKWTFGGIDALETLMIFQFTMHQTTTLQKWMFFQKNVLAAKCLVRHSSTYPKQQQGPLPSLLYRSFFHLSRPLATGWPKNVVYLSPSESQLFAFPPTQMYILERRGSQWTKWPPLV